MSVESVLQRSKDLLGNLDSRFIHAFKNLHDFGIMIGAGIIFDFDNDGPEVFESTLEYLDHHRVPAANFNILTPFPGTPLYDRMKSEGRILTED